MHEYFLLCLIRSPFGYLPVTSHESKNLLYICFHQIIMIVLEEENATNVCSVVSRKRLKGLLSHVPCMGAKFTVNLVPFG